MNVENLIATSPEYIPLKNPGLKPRKRSVEVHGKVTARDNREAIREELKNIPEMEEDDDGRLALGRSIAFQRLPL